MRKRTAVGSVLATMALASCAQPADQSASVGTRTYTAQTVKSIDLAYDSSGDLQSIRLNGTKTYVLATCVSNGDCENFDWNKHVGGKVAGWSITTHLGSCYIVINNVVMRCP
jgi:hypothetical protein